MYCPKCGYKMQDDDYFCRQCGARVNTEKTSKPKNIKRIRTFVFVLVAVMAVGIVAALLSGGNAQQESAVTSDSKSELLSQSDREELDAQIEALKNDQSYQNETKPDEQTESGQPAKAPAVQVGGTARKEVVTIPDPYNYFSSAAVYEFEDGDGWGILVSSKANSIDALARYAVLLEDNYGFGKGVVGNNQNMLALTYGEQSPITYGENDPADVVVYFMGQNSDTGMYEGMVFLPNRSSFELKALEQYSGDLSVAPSSGGSGGTAAIPSGPSVMPNFIELDSSGRYYITGWSEGSVGLMAEIHDSRELDYVVDDYVDELVARGFEIVDGYDEEYTGDKGWTLMRDGYRGTVTIKTLHIALRRDISVTIYWTGDLSMAPITPGTNLDAAAVIPNFIDYDTSRRFAFSDNGGSLSYSAPGKSGELNYVIDSYMKALKNKGYKVVYDDGNLWIVRHKNVNGMVRIAYNDFGHLIGDHSVDIALYGDFSMEGMDSKGCNIGGGYGVDNFASGGGGSSSGSSNGDRNKNIAEFARLDCLKCDGSGNCTHCGGNGEIQKYGQESEWSKCSRCHGNGRCPTCNGSGKR